ncbi:hypothetical protein AAVH_12425 [Aphelenchoides avenae]|nr:hypothetical protein AAVH_12425 [Aphelenchus avenae]
MHTHDDTPGLPGTELAVAQKPFQCIFVRKGDTRKISATEELMLQCTMLQDWTKAGIVSEDEPEVFLPEDEGYQLKHVEVIIEYLQMKQTRGPDDSAPKHEDETLVVRLPEWSTAFFNELQQCDLVGAANLSAFLICHSFKRDVCTYIAHHTNDIKVPQLREYLRIQDDFTENEWKALLADPDFREVIDADGVFDQKTSVRVSVGGFNSVIQSGVAESRLADEDSDFGWRLRRFLLCGPTGRAAVLSSLQDYAKARLDCDALLYRKEADRPIFLEPTEFIIVVRRGMVNVREVVFGMFSELDDLRLKGIEKAEFEWVDAPDICHICRILDDNKDTLKTLVKPPAEILAELPSSLSLDLLVMEPLAKEMEEQDEREHVLSRFRIKRLEYDMRVDDGYASEPTPAFARWIRVEELKLSGGSFGSGSTDGARNTTVQRLETADAWMGPPSAVDFGNLVLHVKNTFPSLKEWRSMYTTMYCMFRDAREVQENVKHLRAAERAFKSLSLKADIEIHFKITVTHVRIKAASFPKLFEGYELQQQTLDPEKKRVTKRVYKREVKLNETVNFKVLLKLYDRV